MAKKREAGNLFQVRGRWYARLTVKVGDKSKRITRALGTTHKPTAELALARLLAAEDPTPAEATRVETFAEAARRIVDKQQIKTKSDRWHRIEAMALKSIGHKPVTEIRRLDVRGVLDAAAKEGFALSTVKHLLVDLASVFKDLLADEIVSTNPTEYVPLPSAKVDNRQRVRLTDAEFEQLLAYDAIDAELAVMAVLSRCIGGMRGSDLHALEWSSVDWAAGTIVIYRPKTERREPHALLSARPFLEAWHDDAGFPTEGPIFPVRRGPRAGERKAGHNSHARRLRRTLWAAGVRRGPTKAECALQTDTPTSKRVDFHSFRRAYTDAGARAGINAQQAAELTGHSVVVHQGYLDRTRIRETPESMIPPVIRGIVEELKKTSAADGTRTRGLRRDRPAL